MLLPLSLQANLPYIDSDGDALTLIVNSNSIGTLDGNASTVVGTVMGEDNNGQLTIYGDGSWTYQLQSNATHDSDDSTFIALELEQFSITVTDGTATSSPVTLTMNIIDDTIQVVEPSDATVANEAGTTFQGTLQTTGADNDTYSASLTSNISGWSASNTFGSTTLTSGGNTVYYFVSPTDTSKLIAYTDSSNSPSGYSASDTNQSLVFEVTAAPNSDSYRCRCMPRLI